MECDYLVVGAGFFGSVMAERIATQKKAKVLIIDKRSHLGGNCYSEFDSETGIEFHQYGTHIFHTSNKKVWDYINQFTEFNQYHHQVLTTHQGRVYQMPINLETINSFYQKNMTPTEAQAFMQNEVSKEQYPHPQNLEEKAISQIGRPLYQAFIKGYTQKQWQKDPKELPVHIINRLPIRYNYCEDYFHQCRWQGIPLDGYTKIFERMLDHPKIQVRLNTDFFEVFRDIKINKQNIYTGPIDRYFEYQFGKLEWRSIELQKEVVDVCDYQGTSVMNYADEKVPYTRIHEPRHLHRERNYQQSKTLIFKENSCTDENNPFYPINSSANQEKLKRYKDLVKQRKNLIIGGRLGSYAYFDMDQVIADALKTFEEKIS